jgi:hypothetical protein
MQRAQVVVFITQRLDGPRPVMEFRAVPNRVNQPPLQEKFSENKIVLSSLRNCRRPGKILIQETKHNNQGNDHERQ